jgi:hypothetical protein
MKPITRIAAGIIAMTGLLLTSCASILSKSTYPVSFTSSPVGAHISVKKNGVVVHEGTTPSTVTLAASSGFFSAANYEVTYSKKGYPSQTVPMATTIDGWYVGNILFGGLIGLLIVDPATGAMWKLPENVNANLTPAASIEGDNGKKIQIVDRSSLPRELQDKLVAIK